MLLDPPFGGGDFCLQRRLRFLHGQFSCTVFQMYDARVVHSTINHRRRTQDSPPSLVPYLFIYGRIAIRDYTTGVVVNNLTIAIGNYSPCFVCRNKQFISTRAEKNSVFTHVKKKTVRDRPREERRFLRSVRFIRGAGHWMKESKGHALLRREFYIIEGTCVRTAGIWCAVL